ncbi:MAG TPA: arginine--tRNA ligase [Longimicrobiales bacterium]|nr:arginine--tRNA ligase [Longimicrobiales bacterium]
MAATDRLEQELLRVATELGAGDGIDVRLERPRNPEHGDLASNLAMVLAGRLSRPPRAIAEDIRERLSLAGAGVSAVEIAGPGFLNFRLSQDTQHDRLAEILSAGEVYGRTARGAGRKVQVEFVSANPTGPLHVAHARGAALGDALASLLEWTGDEVQREYYVNDAGVQIDRLAESLEARWRQLRGEEATLPEEGYRGEYVIDLARAVEAEMGAALVGMSTEERRAALRDWAVPKLRQQHDDDLREFGVRFDEFFPESSIYERGLIGDTLAELHAKALVYEHEGALWMRTSDYGDDKDRVLVKSDGSYTYFLPDLAYHREKWRRGFEHVIDVWGADHHGYVPRMKAALAALGHADFLDVEIVQMVKIMREGREVRLSKRAGEIVTLRDLVRETGVDVARYFFLMRRGDAQMIFDLDLALDQSEKNPVYKIQYAHARIASIFRKAGVEPAAVSRAPHVVALLTEPVEQDLIKQLARFPEAVARAASNRSPHFLAEYLEETSGMINSWYHAGNPSRNPRLAVLVADPELRNARLALAAGARIVLANGLRVLGIAAPERMQRAEEEE